MFTGIIQGLGIVANVTSLGGDIRVFFKSESLDLSHLKAGDSIAVNGVCLTAMDPNHQSFSADVSKETLSKTSLKKVTQGTKVNLECALAVGDALGGHMVSGHVDGLVQLISKTAEGRSIRFVFRAPISLTRFVAPKGSVCLDGVSLTVNSVTATDFDVNIIPHTLEQTIFQNYVPGSEVNLEVDLIARYLDRLMRAQGGIIHDPLNEEDLRRAGFGEAE